MSDDASGPEGRPVALVTGASRGLGFLLARELAERGHDLVLCARSAGGLDAARADLERHGVQVLGVPADIGVAAEAGGWSTRRWPGSAGWTFWSATQG